MDLPFGGVRGSGFGRLNGREGLRACTNHEGHPGGSLPAAHAGQGLSHRRQRLAMSREVMRVLYERELGQARRRARQAGGHPAEAGRVMSLSVESFDYIVVGGGSSGCVVAGELCGETRLAGRAASSRAIDAEDHPETLEADGYKHAFANDDLLLERFSAPQAALPSASPVPRLRPWSRWQRLHQRHGLHARRAETTRAGRVASSTKTSRRCFSAGEQAARAPARCHASSPRPSWRAAEVAGFRRSENMNDGDLSGVIGYETMNYEGDQPSQLLRRLRARGATAPEPACADPRAHAPRGVRGQSRASASRSSRAASVGSCVHAARSSCAPARSRARNCCCLSGVGRPELPKHGLPLRRADLPAVGENLHDHPNVTHVLHGQAPGGLLLSAALRLSSRQSR